MKFPEAKEKFIGAWGTLASGWGINRTMAQVHALLLIAPKPLSTEDIMEEVGISRGNANMNIRALMGMGIVHKRLIPGERKEFFIAEKDLWETAKKIAMDRRRRELEPMLKALKELKQVEGSSKSEEVQEFKKMTADLEEFSMKADKALEKLISADQHWFLGPFMKMMK